ncbi:unnamed protein product [Toxocara canis]|uniref:Transposase n=1 Tax=Toxocara canis TaxID=6265 RepID=A0A183V0P1_TOXCA|nr:unnamed protein product [Toxocara canis]
MSASTRMHARRGTAHDATRARMFDVASYIDTRYKLVPSSVVGDNRPRLTQRKQPSPYQTSCKKSIDEKSRRLGNDTGGIGGMTTR